MKRQLLHFIAGALLVCGLTGCGTGRICYDRTQRDNVGSGNGPVQISYGGCAVSEVGNDRTAEVSRQDIFRQYEDFGLVYNSGKDELIFDGKLVRWFEDYYSVGEGQAGTDYFNENGVTDVYAVRDNSVPVRRADNSYDPKGRLLEIKEFSREEFDARDIEALKHPKQQAALSGEPMNPEEIKKMAEEYEPFGVTYDADQDVWYYNGEKVRFFRDILTSNGESLEGGKFKGSMRLMGKEEGSVDIYTIRDYGTVNSDGNGTLTGVGKYSQEEFDRRSKSSYMEHGGR